MTPEHAFLQAMLEAPDDLGQPLIFADWLEEHGDAGMAELLRLNVTESNSALHSPTRIRRLLELRHQASQRVRAAGWSVSVSVSKENQPGVRFYRSLDSARPVWEHLFVSFARQLVQRAEIITDRRTHAFPPSDKDEKRSSLLLTDLPIELVVPVAWLLCEHLCDRRRRVRSGQVVPGAHFFAFCAGEIAWRHAQALHNRQGAEAETLLREGFHSRSLFGSNPPRGVNALAALLVRVSDQGAITADKLVWIRGRLVKETSDLPRRKTVSLTEGSFRDALVDLKLNAVAAEAFVVATPERLRELFRSQAALSAN